MKTQLILTLYDALICEKRINRKEFCEKYDISERSFYRYFKQIGQFLMHRKVDYILKVDEPYGVYYLEKVAHTKND